MLYANMFMRSDAKYRHLNLIETLNLGCNRKVFVVDNPNKSMYYWNPEMGSGSHSTYSHPAETVPYCPFIENND